jgi:hypothetical protein
MEDDTDAQGQEASGTPDSLLPYDQWMEDALRGVVCRALSHAAAEGLPGQHHFYITFRTDYPGVVIPARLRQKYPQEMTIVLQHQFRNLAVDEAADSFSVSLSFGGVLSPLTIPFASISAFVDPHIQYALRFRVTVPTAADPAPQSEAAAAMPEPEASPETPQVVSLDAFRRRRD